MEPLQEEPESSPLPELAEAELLVPTQQDSSDPAAPIEDADQPAAAVADMKGSMVETPLDLEAELPPSAQSSKHIQPPPRPAPDEAEDASKDAVGDPVEARAGAEVDAEAEAEEVAEEVAEVMELDGEDAAARKGPELADPVEGLEGAGQVEPVELSSECEDEEPVAKRPKRLSHAPLFEPSSQANSEDDLPPTIEIPPMAVNKPPPRDARKEAGVPFKQMTTAHKAGAMKGCE